MDRKNKSRLILHEVDLVGERTDFEGYSLRKKQLSFYSAYQYISLKMEGGMLILK